jgi:1,4-dihydroxy-2-naphthoyl-CoA hydrolase
MFPKEASLERINAFSQNTLVEHLGIEIIEIGENFLVGSMPVDHRTHQPLGLLHGGASVALAETLGSIAATLTLDVKKQYAVGLEINANHIKSAREGQVIGKAEPVHIGKKTHVWQIKIRNNKNELTCISRITMAILDKKA